MKLSILTHERSHLGTLEFGFSPPGLGFLLSLRQEFCFRARDSWLGFSFLLNMNMRASFLFRAACLCASIGLASFAAETTPTKSASAFGVDARMLLYPDVSSTQIAFVYARDIWVAPKTGVYSLWPSATLHHEIFARLSAP